MRILALTVFIVAASATTIDVKNCYGVDRDVCTIHEIRIDPCNKIREGCKFATGIDAEISFDFTPNFSTDKLSTNVVHNGINWPDLEKDGCKATTCPTVAGTKQTYNVKLHIGTKYPKGLFPVEWSVWDTNNNSTNICCFKTTFKLIKSH